MRPAGLAILITFYVRCKAFVRKSQVCNTIFVFGQIEDEPGVSPFLFVRIPGHVTVGNQPNNSFAGNQLRYSKVEERLAAHLYHKFISLFAGTAGKGYSPPCGNVADLFHRLMRADFCRRTAVEIVRCHFFKFFIKDAAIAASGIVQIGT